MWVGKIKTALGYVVLSAAIFSWWFLALSPESDADFSVPIPVITASRLQLPMISPIDRGDLKSALSGDISLITRLMADWDLDAQILEAQGIIGVQRLPQQNFIRGQMLGRHLQTQKPKIHSDKYLPQTYAAASMLFALLSADQIAALPTGMRQQSELFSKKLTDQIPLDLDRYNTEKLYIERPKMAFAAPYSDPASIQSLKNQSIPLYFMPSVASCQEIMDHLVCVGKAVHQSEKGELLALFMESALAAIDNRMKALQSIIVENGGPPKVLFLHDFLHYSTPAPHSLTGQLLCRLNLLDSSIKNMMLPEHLWTVPMTQEKIVEFAPEVLIVSSYDSESSWKRLNSLSAFRKVPALSTQKVFFVDSEVQQYPSQLLVLAYFDLFQAYAAAR